jgi:hypothetical protein
MASRSTVLAMVCLGGALVLAPVLPSHGGTAAEARKKAKRVTSYVVLAETIARVSVQVGGMVERNPYDKALATYARELARLHAKLYAKLTPPPGAEDLHKEVQEAINDFAAASDAHAAGNYRAAHKRRQKAVRQFAKSLLEVLKLKKDGTIPGYAPASGPRRR